MKDINYNTFWDNQSLHSYHPGVRMRNYILLKKLQNLPYKRLLDVGCGDGYLLNRLYQRYSQRSYMGFDLSQKRITQNKHENPNIDYQVRDLSNPMGFSTSDAMFLQAFDVVVCSEVIEHITNWEITLDNAISCMSDDGVLLLTTQAGKRFLFDINIGHVQHFELATLERFLQERGLDVLDAYRVGFPFYTWMKYAYGFLSSFSEKVRTTERFSWVKKCIFTCIFLFFLITPKLKHYGPQLVIFAKKQK